LAATYGGDGSFAGSNGAASLQIAKAASATAVTASSASSTYGQPVIFSATVSAVSPATGTPSGTLTFKDGAADLGQAVLDGNGRAAVSVSALGAGAHAISATYAGDAAFAASSSTAAATVGIAKATSALALAPSIATSVTGQRVTFTVIATSPGGTPTG